MIDRKKKPEAIGNIVASWLDKKGLAERVDQAGVIPEWAKLVGPQIAAVTVAAIDHASRDVVRAGDDERVDERAVASRAGIAAVAEPKSDARSGEADSLDPGQVEPS